MYNISLIEILYKLDIYKLLSYFKIFFVTFKIKLHVF